MSAADGLFLRQMGHGPAPALMLHCGLGVSSMWQETARLLAERLTMTAPDMLGHGRSPDLGEGDVHDQCCATLRPLLREGMHLIGHSFGATLALRLALEARVRVASVTLIEPVLFAAARGKAVFDAHYAREAPVFELFASGDRMATAKGFNAIWGDGAPWESFKPAAQARMAAQMDFVMATKATLWDDAHGVLAPGRLEGLAVPVRLVRGGSTVPIIAEVHRGLMGRLPQASEVVIAGAGHMLVATHAADLAAAMSEHLDAA